MTKTTTAPDIQNLFDRQKKNRIRVGRQEIKTRIEKLKALRRAVLAHQSQIQTALHADFRKHPGETNLSEIFPVTNEIKHTIEHLEDWARPKKVAAPLPLIGSKSYILTEPKGVVLIIAPWNFPFNLTLMPLVSAVAAGNCAILKPSEFTPHTNRILKIILKGIFEEDEVAIVEGAAQTAQELLKLPFDHIFFTGSPRVGKIVMRAAAEHLSSVTLELGGKSPVIVDETADLADAAKKITWGKFINNGQTCIAPDYLLVHESLASQLVEAMRHQIEVFYGASEAERQQSPSYARIITERHFERLHQLLQDAEKEGARVPVGGHTNAEDRYIEPTILTHVAPTSDIMQEEIFGPLLPVLTYKELGEAIHFINQKEKPLALYVFSNNRKTTNTILAYTSAGGTCVNDVVVHYFQSNLPFGGVNNSGIGKSHGEYGFKAFSNERAVLEQSFKYSAPQLMYPPYTDEVEKVIDFGVKFL
ncbi:MAG: aldehyde dehydrogenase family protein [Bernardetiaceae bacterium]